MVKRMQAEAFDLFVVRLLAWSIAYLDVWDVPDERARSTAGDVMDRAMKASSQAF
jgi:hypothetical protein